MTHPYKGFRPGRTNRMAAAVALGLALIVGQSLATPALAAPDSPAGQSGAGISESAFDSGRYIVMLKDRPLATYTGGVAGIPGTAVAKGKKLDPSGANPQKYTAYLKGKQDTVAASKGVAIAKSYTLAVNGFSAELSASQARGLSKDSGVFAVVKDTLHRVDYSSTDFLGLPGADGVWATQYSGEANAGKGIVVGVLDTGYSPDNPYFAGQKVKRLSGAPKIGEPYLLPGNKIAMLKADGTTFVGDCENGDHFAGNECNSKVISARYYDETFKAAIPRALRAPHESYSPLDVDSHGSHTASTAAGNSNISQVVGGRDFGKGSGVAPAAKIAVYKICWEGSTLATTGCFGSSSLEAIEDAITDGVDVLNYSISGNNNSTVDPVSIAFLGAAAAGIFVAASAGNDGPGDSTVNHAGPWLTTVAASTHNNSLRGTVELSNGAKYSGASVMSAEVTGKAIAVAVDVKAAAASDTNAALCFPGSLDPSKTAGKIVICDRGVNARTEKSATVAQAGGVGMVLVNLASSSLDTDLHSVPTVHLDSPAIKAVIQADPTLTASLKATDTTGQAPPPVPQIAGFSSRGPTLASNGDLLKPDVAAPGVAVLAAVSPIGAGGENFGFLSGTSMSSPHIAGFGALLLGKNPLWSPATVKSALMTTAYDLVDASGGPIHDVFAQGAGHIDPARIATPGLVYDAGITDWVGFLQGLGNDFGADPIAAKDVNLPSIGLGSLTGTQTVSRNVTALTSGTYTASVDVPGITATVTPSVLTLAAGQTGTFAVAFTNSGAELDKFATGSLTWTSAANTVRSPVAVRPVTAIAPETVDATSAGGTGSVEIPVTSGASGPIDITVKGLAKANSAPINLVPGPAGDATNASNDVRVFNVAAGTSLAKFSVNSGDPAADFDLFVVSPSGVEYTAATASASESVTVNSPEAGEWTVKSNLYASPGNAATGAAVEALLLGGDEGNLTVTPDPLVLANGESGKVTASWAGLEAGNWVAVIGFGDGASTQLNLTVAAP